MSLGIEKITYAIMTQYDFITKGLNAGKPSKESQDARIEREEEKKRVIPIYNSQGKIVEYPEDNQSYIDNYREFLKNNLKHIDVTA